MVIYYWCVSKPRLIGYGSLFLTGVYKDLLMGIPLGLNALINMILRMLIIKKAKNFKPSFIVFWHGFAIILLIWLAMQTLFFAIITGHWVNINVVLIQFVLSLLFYPVAHSFFNLIYVILPKSVVNG
jgi:rod shape-determining protein MreD